MNCYECKKEIFQKKELADNTAIQNIDGNYICKECCDKVFTPLTEEKIDNFQEVN